MIQPVIDIQEVCFHDPSIKTDEQLVDIGLRVDTTSKAAYIYELKTDNKIRAGDYLFQVCVGVIREYFPDDGLADIQWHYRSGFASTELHFKTYEHGLAVMRLSNILGLEHGSGTLEEYKKDYYQEVSSLNMGENTLTPPSYGKTYYVLTSGDGRNICYMVKEQGQYETDYMICLADTQTLVSYIRDQQPLVYQATPDLMFQNERLGKGQRLRLPLTMTKLYCQLDIEGAFERLDIIEMAEATLGLLDQQFAALPVRVRHGVQSKALRELCGVEFIQKKFPLPSTEKESVAAPSIVQFL